MVAMLGAIIAAPLQTPLSLTVRPPNCSSRVDSLGTVSVVMMPRAASSRCAGLAPRADTTRGNPAASVSFGRNRPITPVEQTSMSAAGQPSRRATSAVIHSASARPRSPVQAFELPELMTTPRAVARGTLDRETLTGAPCTRFVVNTPAAEAGTSETNSDRSNTWGSFLIPQCRPAARNPWGRGNTVTDMPHPSNRESRRNEVWSTRPHHAPPGQNQHTLRESGRDNQASGQSAGRPGESHLPSRRRSKW
jgi:hypothetical protein